MGNPIMNLGLTTSVAGNVDQQATQVQIYNL